MATGYQRQEDRHAQVAELETAIEALRHVWVVPPPTLDDAPPPRVWAQQQQPELAAAIERVVTSWDAVASHARQAPVRRERRRRERVAKWVVDMVSILAWGWR